MKKSLLLFAILLICLIVIIPKTAHADSSNDYRYWDNGDGTCKISSYFGSANGITIPETLVGLTVTHIADDAFLGEASITHITLPDSLIFIGDRAFKTMSLFMLDLGDGVEYIGNFAFTGGFFSVPSLPDSLNYLEVYAFPEDFTLPEGTGEWYQFDVYSSSKTGRTYSGGDKVSCKYGYALNDYKTDRNTDYDLTITQYTGNDQTLNLPATLEGKYISYVQEDVFASKGLTSVSLRSGFNYIKYIGHGAFANNNISSITLADSLLQIGLGAFADNSTDTFILSSGDWLVFDEDGYTGETASGGDRVSADFGYTQIDNNKPSRTSATSSETILVTDTYTVNLSNIFKDNYYDTLTYQVSIDGADYIDADENFSFAPSTVKDYTLVFRAFDFKEYSDDTYTVTLTVRPTPTNYPTLKSGIPSEVNESIITYQGSVITAESFKLNLSTIFEDSHDYDLSYQVSIDGADYISANEAYSYTSSTPGDYTLIFRAYNGKNYSTETYTVNLSVLLGFTVIYRKGEATSGSVPLAGYTSYVSGEEVTALENINSLTRTEYVFTGWNTSADGSGTHFDADGTDTFAIYANTTLYPEFGTAVITSGGTYDIADIENLFAGGILRIATTEPVTLTGTAPGSDSNNGANITCDKGVNLTLSDFINKSSRYALQFSGVGNTLMLEGDNTLSSKDGFAGIQVLDNVELTIDSDSDGTLTASGRGGSGAGIGGGYNTTCGSITINGGTISATGGGSAPGIGGCYIGTTQSITINGGTVSATGGYFAAGIGGSSKSSSGPITINGGTVSAKGGEYGAGIGGGYGESGNNITINGGTINANGGKYGAGIGGGENGNSGNIMINGGTLVVVAGWAGAGIGGGIDGEGETITITDGNITTTGGVYGAGIGGGYGGDSGEINISGGTILANGGSSSAGIGSFKWGGHITISGGDITASGGQEGAGIGCGGEYSFVTISGGSITATGGEDAAGIGGNDGNHSGTITITGGEIEATGGNGGAGIGSGVGDYDNLDTQTVGSITISNSNIVATGGEGGAGIGGGNYCHGGTITISSSTVIATSSGPMAAGIGGGDCGNSGFITIDDGSLVFARGYDDMQYSHAIGLGHGFNSEGEHSVNQTITIAGASTKVFTLNGSLTSQFTLEDGIVRYDEEPMIVNELAFLGLSSSPWTDASCVYSVGSTTAFDVAFLNQSDKTVTNMPDTQRIVDGGKVTIPSDPICEGYVFDGWYTDSACTTLFDFTEDTVTSILILYAGWTEALSLEVWDSSYGSVSPVGTYDLLSGDNFTFTAKPNSNCSLDSITVTAHGTSLTDHGDDTYTINGITTSGVINVRFNPPYDNTVYHSVNVVSNGNGSVSPSNTFNVGSGNSLTFTATPDSGYMLDNLTTTATHSSITTSGNTCTISNITSDCTVYVDFEQINYLIEISSGANGYTLPSTRQKVTQGDDITIFPIADTNYEVDTVSSTATNTGITENSDSSYTISGITSAGTISVSYTGKVLDVEIITGANGSVSPSGSQTINSGDNLTITPSPDTGYEVDEVTVSTGNTIVLQSDGSYEVQNITQDCTINVTFKPISYTLSYDNNGGAGSISDADVCYDEIIVLSGGAGFTKPKSVLEKWDIGYLGGLYTVSGDVVASAVWADDTDEDGVSDDDERAAGTDPNDVHDKPQEETIKITLLDHNGTPLSGYTVVLNSSPVFNTTGSSGTAVFAGVSLSPHTLSIRNGLTEIGRYTLSFTKSSNNSSTIASGGTAINTTNNQSFWVLDVEIRMNGTGTSGLITNASIRERANREENPNTGEK